MDYSDPSVGQLRLAQMSDNAKRIFQERYCLKGETIEEAVWRVAKHVSRLNPEWEVPFFNHIATFTGVPNSPTFTGAGTPLAQLSACFTLDIEDSIESIMQTLKDAAVIQKSGGGLGFNFSKIRPRNALIISTNKPSQGVCSWIKMYDEVFNNILQSCFSGEMRIATDKGLIKAEDLNNRILQGERFKAWTHKGYRNIIFTFPNGKQDLYKVVTKKGVELEVTGNHKITTLDSSGKIALKRLEELYVGDEILLAVGSGNVIDEPKLQPYVETNTHNRLNTEIKLPTHMNEELAYILGFSYGDGYVSEGEALKLAVGEDEVTIQERLILYIKNQFNYDARIRQGDGRVKIITINSITVIEWLRNNGLLKQKSAFIHVPETIFQSSSLSMTAFVAGYFDADGSDRKKKGGYGFDSISLQMIKDVQQLLAYNGIVSHIFEQKRKKWSTLYRLIVSGGYFRNVFQHTIPAEKIKGVPSLKDYSNTYPNTVVENTPNKYYDGIYSGNAERITYTSFKRTVENMLLAEVAVEEEVSLLNLVPDKILSVEPIGIEETYDFEVEDVHLLSGNGVYTSNSRRGANISILRCDHPDVFDFIELKSQETSVTNFNISILFDKNFMTALQEDKTVELWWTNPAGERVVEDVLPAKDIWHAFIQHTWQHSEPSALFEDNINRDNPLEKVYGKYIVTNPCVTGDTLISVYNKWTDDEDDLQYNNCTEITMYDLHRRWQLGEKDIQVITDSRIQEEAYVDISNVFITGEKEVFEIKTSQGNSVKATANHLIMTQKGWVEVQDLRETDSVYLCDRQYSNNLDPIVSVTLLGVELVYDITVPDANSFIANGIVVHNCAEIPMKEYESCNLSCIALDNFVDWEGDFRWEEFQEAIRVNTYLLNGIVDTNELPVAQIVEMNRKYRRIGNGITGLHDAMIKMGVPYNSPEGVQFIEKVMAYVTFYGLKTSNVITQERGIVFEDFEQSLYATGLDGLSVDFKKHISAEEVQQLSEAISNHGLANTHVSMIAPTGTRSTVSDKGGYGVEPIFAYSYKRWVTENNDSDNRYSISVVPKIFNEYLDRYKQNFDRAEILAAIEDNYGSIQGLDKYFSKPEQQLLVDANSISPDDHVQVLAAAQVYTQQAISKTINCPHNTSVEELIVLFEKAWELGCKGLTVYRNASRNKVVIETTKKQVTSVTSNVNIVDIGLVATENSPESWDDMVCNLTDGTCISCA